MSHNQYKGQSSPLQIQCGGTGIILGHKVTMRLTPFGLSLDSTKLGRWTSAGMTGCLMSHFMVFAVYVPKVTTCQSYKEPGDMVQEQHERYLAMAQQGEAPRDTPLKNL